jgi:RecB family exonuclease
VSLGAWSYSSLKAFKTCPKQYYEVRVAKNFSFPEETEATRYGTDFHTAAELYVRDDTPLPLHFNYVKSYLDTLKSLPGDKYCEYRMALTKDLQPCEFRAPDVWCRGVADLLVVNNETGVARVVDYKTGKSAKYADTAQLELMALMVFKHFPKIRKVKGGLLFVVANDFRKDTYDVSEEHTYWRTWMTDVARLENAHRTGVWNPNKSGLCRKHCPVVTCVHNGANQ